MSVIDDFLKNVASPQKEALEHVRQVIKIAVPDAEEVISYGMPGFRYNKKYLVTFNAFKDHMSLFPGGEASGLLADKIASFKASKGTVQFTTEHPLPDELIKELVLVRVRALTANVRGVFYLRGVLGDLYKGKLYSSRMMTL